MNVRARGFFIAGSAGLALGGVLQLWDQFAGGESPLALSMIKSAMRAYEFEGMDMTHSLMDVMQCWGACFGVLAIFGGLQNLIAVSLLPRSSGLGLLSATSALCAAVLLGVAIDHHIPPPLVVFGLVFLCFAAATVLAMGSTRPGDGLER